MSKRYREVLEEVETPASRRAAARDMAAPVDEVEGSPGPAGGVQHPGEEAIGQGAGSGGGVGVLVRATRTTATTTGAGTTTGSGTTTTRTTPGSGPSRRPSSFSQPRSESPQPSHANHPGNGPVDAEQPLAFAWRGRHYEVTRVLGHWREEEGWWRRPDGEPIRIEQSDLWRVEAARNPHAVMASDGPHPSGHGVYELSRRGTTWRLDRVWD